MACKLTFDAGETGETELWRKRWPGRRIQELDSLAAVFFTYYEADRVQPLEPRHHSIGIVPNQVGVDSVGVENRLRDMRFDFVGKRPDDRVELRRVCLHLPCLPQASDTDC